MKMIKLKTLSLEEKLETKILYKGPQIEKIISKTTVKAIIDQKKFFKD